MKNIIRVKYRRKEALRLLNPVSGQYESQRITWRYVKWRFSTIARKFDSAAAARLYIAENSHKDGVFEYRVEVKPCVKSKR